VTLAADTRSEYDALAGIYLPVAIVVLVVVALAILLALARGLRRTRPSTRRNRTALELGYIGVLVVVAGVLLAFTFRTDQRIVGAAAPGAERVRVIGARWHWSFEYPARGIVVRGTDERIPTLVVPRGRPVAFEGRSEDVIHGFWIPEMRFQREIFSDRTTRWRMTFDTDVDSAAPCSFFCGLAHGSMRFRVRVLAPGAFAAWARRTRG
jgi:cytochrome c oxidase subunit II